MPRLGKHVLNAPVLRQDINADKGLELRILLGLGKFRPASSPPFSVLRERKPLFVINNKVPLYSTGNCIHYPVINHKGKECEKEYI